MHRAVAAIIFLWCIVQCAAVQIVEFCPDPYLADDADEYVVLSGTGLLDGIMVSDGEGGFYFPPGSVIDGKITVAKNAVAFKNTHGMFPDFEWFNYSPDVPDVISGDRIRLANARDELILYSHGKIVQTVSWPDNVKTREGQVHYLENGTWDRRPLFIGQSRFEPGTFENVSGTAFVSPDNSFEVFVSAVASARRSLRVNVYEFSSTDLARPLIDAHRRGVNVTVLVEGGPVGGISPEEKTVIWTMNQSGIPVFQMGKTGDTRLPYRFDHAKYLIIDDQAVLLTSENFKTSGFPPQGRKGNRGWGVCIENEPLAAYFENMFTTDIGGIHIVPVTGSPGPAESPSRDPYTVEYVPYRFSGAQVTPVIAPDTSYQIVGLLNSANSTIDIEQAYITNESANLLNPFLGAAINASRRGVRVRILLDSYWYNTDDEKDNDEMVALINTVAATENLPLEARCADLVSGNIEKIHNKGVIIDNRSVLVSSINWNTNSPDFNREAGVIIVHDGVAGYFRNVFDDDWQPVRPSLKNTPDYFKFSGLIVIVLLLFVLYALRRYRR